MNFQYILARLGLIRDNPTILQQDIQEIIPIVVKTTDMTTLGEFSYEIKVCHRSWNTNHLIVTNRIIVARGVSDNLKNLILIHEFTHLLQCRLIPEEYKKNKIGLHLIDGVNRFFGDETHLILSELIDIVMFFRTKTQSEQHYGRPIKPSLFAEDAEKIAIFGPCLYAWTEETKSSFPMASECFIRLLREGYYGEDAKKIFRKLLKEP